MRIFIPVILTSLYLLIQTFSLDQTEPFSKTSLFECAHPDTLIQMERTVCFGTCPAYVLTIHGNGNVIFEGKEFVSHEGTVKGEISEETLNELMQIIEDINLMEIPSNPECKTRMTDLPSVYLTVEINGKRNNINHYHGCRGFDHEDELYRLESAIDSLSGANQWIREE